MKKFAFTMVSVSVVISSLLFTNNNPDASDFLVDPNLEEAVKYQLGILEKTRVTDEQLESLNSIDASWFGVRELTGIEDAVNVQAVYLEGNKLVQINELSSLPSISVLTLRDNDIVDLSPLKNLKKLSTLDLSGNQIHSIQPLSTITFMGRDVTLDISRNNLTSITPFKTTVFPSSLEYFELNLSDNQLKTLDGMENISSITHFNGANNQLTNIGSLKQSTLKYVNLSNNKLTSIESLKYSNPSTLLLSNNQLSSLNGLNVDSDQMYYLDFSRNSIKDINALSRITSGLINLENNKIVDLSPLKNMTSGQINIKGNPLTIGNQQIIAHLMEKGVSISHDNLIDDRVVTINRLAGANRYATAASISSQGWNTSQHVVLARGDSFPDALAGVPYAFQLDAPILLSEANHLPSETVKEIKRLGAKKVTILGGNAAISANVENYLKNTMKLTVERIAGSNRFDTAVKINEKLNPSKDKAILVFGQNFPDALAIASYSAQKGIPIYLTDKDTLPYSTKKSLASYKSTMIVGGTAVISEKVAKMVNNPTRIGGNNRFDTAAKISNSLKTVTEPSGYVFFGNGHGFADSLSGSVLAAKYKAPLLLVEKDSLPFESSKAISTDMYTGYILGGEAVIDKNTSNKIKSHLMEGKK